MSAETNKAIVRRLLEEVWNQKQIELIEEFFTDDVVEVSVGHPPTTGLEGVKMGTAVLLNAFPDLQLTITDEIAEGDKVVIRWGMQGTHQGDLMAIPASGAEVSQTGVTVYRLANARIAELWFFPDNLGLLQQLGVIPVPEAA